MKTSYILVVEDDEWLAKQQQRHLLRAGYEVGIATHAAGAIDMIDDRPPAVIVLDMTLAGSTGMALLNELQSHVDLATIPVVVTSSATERMSLAQLRPYGVRVLLDKITMHPNDVVHAVKRLIA